MSLFPTRRPLRAAPAGIAALVVVFSLGACAAGDNSTEKSDSSAARMAFANGFGGGGPNEVFIAGLSCYAEKNGLEKPLITTADGDVNKQLADMDSLIARQKEVDGIFVMPADPAALKPAYDRAKDAGIAVIDPISPDPDGNFVTPASSHVAPDDLGVPTMIADYFSKEHPEAKNVVVLSPPRGTSMATDRAANFKAAAESAGMKVVGELNLEKITTVEAQQQMEDFLTKNRDTQAVFAQNGAMGRGAALAAKSQGVDLVVVSLDDDEETLAAVERGDIAASFGADLFAVAYKGSEQAQAVKDDKAEEFVTVPYTMYTQGNSAAPSFDERCSAY